MQESERQTDDKEKSASVEISEADYFDAGKYGEAVDALLASLHADEMRRQNLIRPHISVWRALLNILLPLAVATGIFCALFFTLPRHRLGISLGVSLGALGLYVLLRMRAVLIWCILVYQATAPDEVRLRCVFTPSCSEYALQALRKYGVLRGVPKIIGRLRRCHPPNGGTDELR